MAVLGLSSIEAACRTLKDIQNNPQLISQGIDQLQGTPNQAGKSAVEMRFLNFHQPHVKCSNIVEYLLQGPYDSLALPAGPFIIFNEADEAATMKRFFDHMQEVLFLALCGTQSCLRRWAGYIWFNFMLAWSCMYICSCSSP